LRPTLKAATAKYGAPALLATPSQRPFSPAQQA
jgi:hypothetical protein